MTIENQNLQNDYVAFAGQTTFAYDFRILDDAHIEVEVNDVVQVGGYSVTGVDSQSGGNVVFDSGLVANDRVSLKLNPPITQETEYQFNSKFPELAHETALDKLTQICLTLKGRIDTFVNTIDQAQKGNPAVGAGVSSIAVTLASPFSNTNYSISVIPAFNSNGWWISSKTTTGFIINFATPPDSVSSVSWAADQLTAVDVGTLIVPAFGTNSIVFASGALNLAQDSKLKWNNTTKVLTVGDTGIVDTDIHDKARVAEFIKTANEDNNEFGLTVQMDIPSFVSTGSQLKAASISKIRTAKASPGGNPFHDAVAMYGQGVIAPGNLTGRVWGAVAEAFIEDGSSDGQLIGAEVGVINQGTNQGTVNTVTSKYNLVLSGFATTFGTQPVTAAVWFNGIPGAIEWHYGLFMQCIADRYIEMVAPPAGAAAIGIEMQNSANWSAAMVLPNNKDLRWFDAAGTASKSVLSMDTSDLVVLGGDAASVFIFSNATSLAQFSPTIADGETALLIRRDVAGVETVVRVSMGAVDSGGAGFKLLRVPN